MAILDLLKHINNRERVTPHPVVDKEIQIRQSFLLGLAMQAYADGRLSDDEAHLFFDIAKAFQVAPGTATSLLEQAKSPTEEILESIRRNLLHHKYKYYFLIDLHIMARQDNHVSKVESQVIEQFAKLLDMDSEEMSFVSDLARAVISNDPKDRKMWINTFMGRQLGGQALETEEFEHYAPKDHAVE